MTSFRNLRVQNSWGLQGASKEVSLTLTELNLVTKLSEEGTDHHVVEVAHLQIGMSMGMQTILRIQDLAREATLRTL